MTETNIIEKFEELKELLADFENAEVSLETVRAEDGWPVAFWDIEEAQEEGIELKHEIGFGAGGEDEEEDEEANKAANLVREYAAANNLTIESDSRTANSKQVGYDEFSQIEGVTIRLVG